MSDEDIRALVRGLARRGRDDVRPRRRLRRLARLRGALRRRRHPVARRARRDRAADQGRHPTDGNGAYFDFSYEHILDSVDESLAALRTDYIDVLLLHRPDALVEPDEVAKAFDELHAAGKVHHFGVSNHTPGQVELLKKSRHAAARVQPGAAEHHARERHRAGPGREHGRARPVDRPRQRHPQLLAPERHDAAGLVAVPEGLLRRRLPRRPRALRRAERRARGAGAAAHGVTPTGIAVAWITRHPAHFQVVLGTTNPQRVRDSAAGSDVELTREEWYRIFTAAGHTVP